MDAAHVSLWTRKPALLGYSMGGRLALHLAAHHSERFSSVVLESASPGLHTDAERAERRRLDQDRADELTRDFSGFLDNWYRMPLFASLPDGVRTRLIADRSAHDPSEIARALVGMGTGAQAPLWHHLAHLALPVYALAGSLDTKFAGLARQMEAKSGGLTASHVIEGAGHMIHVERSSAFNVILARLLAS